MLRGGQPLHPISLKASAAELPGGLAEVEGLLDLAAIYRRHAPTPEGDFAVALRAAVEKSSGRN